MKPCLHGVLCCVTIVACAIPAEAATYIASILHPVAYGQSMAQGASNYNQVGRSYDSPSGGSDHALLWNGNATDVVDLNPAGWAFSYAFATSGSHQVGYVSSQPPLGGTARAFLWSGSAESAVDLHPPGAVSSRAYGVSGNSQVGWVAATSGNSAHAYLWNGTATNAVDLHPDGYVVSAANAVHGSAQVGYADVDLGGAGVQHAMLWQGTAASAIDLHPANFSLTNALGVFGDKQVGYGRGTATNGQIHALLWSGAAASVIDLNPGGNNAFRESRALGISAAGQVGWARGNDNFKYLGNHAFVWQGSAASGVDLHPLLSGLGYGFSSSQANGISDSGVIVGVAGTLSGASYAVMWTPVPEPASGVLVAIVAVAAMRWRRPPHSRSL